MGLLCIPATLVGLAGIPPLTVHAPGFSTFPHGLTPRLYLSNFPASITRAGTIPVEQLDRPFHLIGLLLRISVKRKKAPARSYRSPRTPPTPHANSRCPTLPTPASRP